MRPWKRIVSRTRRPMLTERDIHGEPRPRREPVQGNSPDASELGTTWAYVCTRRDVVLPTRSRLRVKGSQCVRHMHAQDAPKRQSACADPSRASQCVRRSTRKGCV